MSIRIALAALFAVAAASAMAPSAHADAYVWHGPRPPVPAWHGPVYRPYPYRYAYRPVTPFFLGYPPVIYRPPVVVAPPPPPRVYVAPPPVYYYGY